MDPRATPSLFPCYKTEKPHLPSWVGIALWTLVALAMVGWQWVKLQSFWGDAPRWIFECWRAMQGELPYRDFAWQYPPLSLWLISGAFRLFGATFATANAVVGLTSVGILVLTWRLARKFLPEWLSLAVPTVILNKCGTFLSPINLFSLMVYTPAAPLNMLFLLVFLLGAVGYIQEGNRLSSKRLALMALGGFGTCLSKPEGALVVVLSFLWLFVTDRQRNFKERPLAEWLRFYVGLGLACFLPAALIYIGLGVVVGFGPMIEGITAYGAATISCPLWPTGQGLLSLVSETAFGVGAVAAATLLFSLIFRSGQSGKVPILPLTLVSLASFIVWLFQFVPIISAEGSGGFARGVLRGLTYAPLSTTTKWLSLFLVPFHLALILRKRPDALTTCSVSCGQLLLTMLTIHSRYLFATVTGPTPEDAVLAAPYFAILNGYLLVHGIAFFQQRFQKGNDQSVLWLVRAEQMAVAILMVFFLYSMTNSIRKGRSCQFVAIESPAGTAQVVKEGTIMGGVAQGELSAAVYRYVSEHTAPEDYVLDIDYGGAINFTTRRRSPVFSTQFLMLKPSERVLQADRKRAEEHPPTLAISLSPEIQGIYGVNRPVVCPCPRFVWRPTEMGHVPGFKFPVLEYVKENYTLTETIPSPTEDSAYIYRKR